MKKDREEEETQKGQGHLQDFGIDIFRPSPKSAPVYQAWISIRGVMQAKACYSLEEAQAWILEKVEEVEGVH